MHQSTLYPVQYLRFAAAMAVFFYHISSTIRGAFADVEISVDEIGAAGVDLFFVISGFIMAMLVARDGVSSSGFLIRRIIRIAPLYFAVTLVVFGVALVAPSLLGSTTADPLQLLHSLLFLPYGMNGPKVVPTLNIGWTLNYEMFFYVLIACINRWFNDRSLALTSAIIIALVVLGLIFQPVNGYLAFYTDTILLEFVFGIIVYQLWKLTSNKPSRLLFGALCAIALVVIVVQFERSAGEWRVLFWGVPSAALLLGALNAITFKSEWLRRLGDWSYSIYLLHLFVIMVGLKIVLPAIDFYTPWQVHYLVMTVGLIAGSGIVYIWFERPVTRWLNARFSPAT